MRFLSRGGLPAGCGAGALFAQDSSRNKKDDPSQIGNRDVGKGVNIYSIEREMALGKQLAQEVQRQAKVVEDPLISEYINRIGQNLAAQLRRQGAVHLSGDRRRFAQRLRAAGRLHLRLHRPAQARR